MLAHALAFAACLVALGFGSFLIAMASSRCLKGCLYSISQNTKPKANLKRVLGHFIEFIELHTHVKQLSEYNLWHILSNTQYMADSFTNFRLVRQFSYIFQPMLAALFLWSLVTICGALLIMQIELVEHFQLVILLVRLFKYV